MALLNGSKLAKENWLLDKEELYGYAPSNSLEMLVDGKGNKIEDVNTEIKTRNSLRPIGKGLLAFATSGDMSPPSPENPFFLMKQDPKIFINLVVLTVCWCSISFNKYLISFNLKHIQGNIFINAMLSPIADIIGHLLCVPVQKYTNTKLTFMGSLLLSFIFGGALIFVKQNWLIPVMIVFSKIGLASGYSLCYYMTSEYFPPLFLAFAFGVTQFLARALTILAFPLSELEAPLPMVLFSITPIIAFTLLFFVQSPTIVKEIRKESIQLIMDKEMRKSLKPPIYQLISK